MFKIVELRNTNPHTYFIVNYKNEPILGGFHDYELQKVKYTDFYLVEKIIKIQKVEFM